MAMANQIVQVAVRRSMDESLLGHPEIVEHLREIFITAVGDKGDHALATRLIAAITQRRRQHGAGR